MITLADLKDRTREQVLDHLARGYSGDDAYYPTEDEINKARVMLDKYDVLVAYESVGDWGCDSSAYFLLEDLETQKLFEIHASHCSCYGFEGQLDLEEINLESVQARVKNGGYVFHAGGYDGNSTENQKIVADYILNLKQ